uniref:Thioesterase/thiol ester dehydrase-isomerase n=1 Tax=Rhabditophanes sp. KR3021 TaxID=114890 RepID=A0AC35TS98_9BILA
MSIVADVVPQNSKDPVYDYFGLDTVSENVFKSRQLRLRMTANIAYGGQIFTHAIAAGEKTVPDNVCVHSCHSYFIKMGTGDTPIFYHVERIRDGKSFYSRLVKAIQNGEVIFTAQMSFHCNEESTLHHQEPMKDVPRPEDLENTHQAAERYLEAFDQGKIKFHSEYIHKSIKMTTMDRRHLFETRPTDPDAFFCIKKYLPPKSESVWVRSLYSLGDDSKNHRAMVAYISDATLSCSGYYGHITQGYKPSMVFSLDHTIYFHEKNFRADEWLLYESYSTKATSGRVLANGKFYTMDGVLVASTAQECLVRTSLKSKA